MTAVSTLVTGWAPACSWLLVTKSSVLCVSGLWSLWMVVHICVLSTAASVSGLHLKIL